MPANERLIQSSGVPETFLLDDGRMVELRRGCLLDCETRRLLTTSDETTSFVLRHALLSFDDHLRWAEFGPAICASAAMSVWVHGWGACR